MGHFDFMERNDALEVDTVYSCGILMGLFS